MKKKTLILTGLCALGLFTWEVQAFSPKQVLVKMDKEDNHIPSTAERIRLQGKLDKRHLFLLTMVMIIKNFVGNCSLQFPLSL